MNLMRTPFRLLFLAFLGACTSGAPSSGPQEASIAPGQATPTEVSLRNLDTAQQPAVQEPTTQEPDAGTGQVPLPPTEEDAFALLAHADLRAAQELFARLMSEKIAELDAARHPADPAVSPDPAQLETLQAELEWLTFGFLNATPENPNEVALARLLARIPVDPSHGPTWVALNWMKESSGASLGRINQWQFIGPFDNERGAAMDAPLAVEADPGSDKTFPGKVRNVTWRTTPESTPRHDKFDFSELLRPAEQSAVMVRTWLKSDTAQDIFLLVAAEGEIKAWHNGEPKFEAFGRHYEGADSHHVALSLQEGWNEIAIKLGSRDHAPVLTARTVDAQGRVVHVPFTHTPPPEVMPHVLSSAHAPEVSLNSHPSALGYYTRRIEADPEDAEAFFRLAALESLYQATPVSEFPGRDHARRAVELAPDVARYRARYAGMLFPDRNTLAEEVDLNPWLEQAQQVLEGETWTAVALAHRAVAAVRFQGLEKRTLEMADRCVDVCKGSPAMLALRAALLEAYDHDLLAKQDYYAILAHPDADFYTEESYTAIMELYPSGSPERLERLERLLALAPKYAAVQRTVLNERALKRNFFDTNLELEELEMRLALDPLNSGMLRGYAEMFQSQGNLNIAFQLVQRALEWKPESPRSLALLARLHLDAGNLEEAVATLERELEIDYSAEDESRLLEHLRSLDGASFEQPYREDLAAIIERHGERNAEQDAADHSHEYLLYRSVIRINPDSTADRYFRKVIRVLNPNGVRRLDVVGFPYAYGDEDLRVESVTVTHPDGTVENARTARGWRGRQVDLPQLQVGDVIDMEWRVDDLRTTYFGKYFGLNHAMTPDRSVPTRESQLVLLVPEELPLKFHTKLLESEAEVAETERFGTSHSWTAFDLAPERIESLMPHAEETVARVQASSYASWDAFGAWWWNLIEDGISVSPEMKDKVAELVEGKVSLRDKVSAIYAFVANDIRYNAWEFGVHGYQPYTAPVIFSRQFGDCKDKGILLRAMLSEIGVEAYPVLILRTADGRHGGRRFEEDLELAMVNHFNHCIAYIPPQQDLPGLFVDGTARLHPLEVLPYDDRGAQVLVVKPDGIERVRIPFSDATDNLKAQDFMIEYQVDGSALVDLFLAPSGRFDPEYRNAFAGGDQERKDIVERILTSLFGPLDGDANYDIPDVENLEEALVVQLGGKASSLARVVDGGLEVPFMLDRQGLLQSLASESERTTDLLMDAPYVRSVSYEFTIPEGYVLDSLPEAVEGRTDDATYRWEVQALDGSWRVTERFEMLTHRVPLERYHAFRDLCRLVDSTQDRFFGATAPPPPPPPTPMEMEEVVEETPEEEVVEDQQ